MMQPAYAQAASIGNVSTSQLIALTNQDRASQGLGSVSESSLLDQAASLKAADMAAKGYFSHTSPGGETSWTWFKEAGYAYVYAGENLAEGYGTSQAVNTAWLNSPEHRANIMKPQYTQIGMAVSEGTYNGQEVIFVVQMFGSPQPGSLAARSSADTQHLAAATLEPAGAATNASEPATRVLGTQAAPALAAQQLEAQIAQLLAEIRTLQADLASRGLQPVA